MNSCLFCNIVNGKLPCYKIYEDENFLSFLDIYPAVYGHSLVIPKKHYQWVYEVPEFGEYWETVLKVTRLIQKALKPKFVTYFTYGLQIPHAHVHILPRGEKDSQEIVPQQKAANKKELEKITSLIKNNYR